MDGKFAACIPADGNGLAGAIEVSLGLTDASTFHALACISLNWKDRPKEESKCPKEPRCGNVGCDASTGFCHTCPGASGRREPFTFGTPASARRVSGSGGDVKQIIRRHQRSARRPAKRLARAIVNFERGIPQPAAADAARELEDELDQLAKDLGRATAGGRARKAAVDAARAASAAFAAFARSSQQTEVDAAVRFADEAQQAFQTAAKKAARLERALS